MGRRNTRASQILESARRDMEMADARVKARREELEVAKAVYSVYSDVYQRLLLELAPQPRQPAATKATTKKRTDTFCGTCGARENSYIHNPDEPDNEHYHPFVKPKKKSSPKKRAGLPRDDAADEAVCRYEFPDSNGTRCGETADHNVHHMMSMVDFHPFDHPSAAHNAAQASPANGAGSGSIPNSEAATASAQVAAGGSSE